MTSIIRGDILKGKKLIGKIKYLNLDKQYGYIKREGEADVAFNFTDIRIKGIQSLKNGQAVEYSLLINNGKYRAKDIIILEHNNAIEHDTEDKQFWCKEGEEKEIDFVRDIVPRIGRKLIIHPMKSIQKTYIDLLNTETKIVADQKVQNTPFFTAKSYGCNPQYTVTFNRKDYENYVTNYPEAIIYWWVSWKQLQYGNNDYKINVTPMSGIWEVSFSKIREKIEKNLVPLHPYKHRIGDIVNAKDSYLFDLNDFDKLL